LPASQTSLFKMLHGALSREERIQLVGVTALILIGAVLETLSIGVVLPFLIVMVSDDPTSQLTWLPSFVEQFDREQLLMLSLVVVVVIYSLKTVFVLWSNWVQSGIKTKISARVTQSLFDSYLKRPYEFYLTQNSSVLLRNLQNAGVVVSGGIEPLITVFSDTLVSLALLTLLIIVEPQGTLITLVLFLLYGLSFDRFTRRRLRAWGESRQEHLALLIKNQQQAIGGIKEIRIRGVESAFLRGHEDSLSVNARMMRRFQFMATVPRVSLELLTLIGISVLVIYFVGVGLDDSYLVPKLGLFAVTAYRIQPAMTRFISAVSSIRYYRPSISDVAQDLNVRSLETLSSGKIGEFKRQIELQDVSFRYAGSTRLTLQNVSLVIGHGDSVGIVGESGAGKSTLIDLMMGLLEPSSGRMRVDDIDVFDDIMGWQRQIGYVPQSVFLIDDSIAANVALGIDRELIDFSRLREVVADAGLSKFVDSLPHGWDTKVGERGAAVSGGERQRIGIARALYHKPNFLILDEPTSSLDLDTERVVIDSIGKLVGKVTLVLVTHRESALEVCNRTYLLEKSGLIQRSHDD